MNSDTSIGSTGSSGTTGTTGEPSPARESSGATDIPSELLAIVFQGETRAGEVLAAMRRLQRAGAVDLHNAACVTRDAAGKVAIQETNDFTAAQGAVTGAALGAVIGLLRGKLLGDTLLGGGIGFLAGKALDLGFDDHFLQAIGDSLTPDSSALVLAIQFERLDEALRVLAPYHGHVIHQSLPADQAQQLAAAMEG